jgi:chemotaxis protein methyltransferase CheR
VCAAALKRHPLSVELHYLHSVLLVALAQSDNAIRAARRIVYLDSACEIGYFTLGGLLRRTGDLTGARRAYRNARDLLVAQPADALVPLSDGERAGRLAELAAIELDMLSETSARVPQ